uniref:Centromere protein I n=1 Tax=Leptobrachium leishanense TaxID=445787 RepID=A0A8C5W9G2_9ANUR
MAVQDVRRSFQRTRQDSSVQQLDEAIAYFKTVCRNVSSKDSLLSKHLSAIEVLGMQHGIPADGIDFFLDIALSSKLADSVNTRLLRSLLPASEIPKSSVIKGVSLFCAGKCSSNMKVLFIRWLITVYDLIPCKDVLSSLYNFFFIFLQDDKLCPYLCHLLYLITSKDHVRPYRVRKLLELQNKKGSYPPLLGLLSIYKIFCPEMVSFVLPSRLKNFFKGSNLLWTSELRAVVKRNTGDPTMDRRLFVGEKRTAGSRKRKWNCGFSPPVSTNIWSSVPFSDNLNRNETFPIEKLQTFSQLLENIHRLELPAQMGSVLKNPLLLHYINCIKEDTPFLRLNYWLASTLQEECAWYTGKTCDKEAGEFLGAVVEMQQFLQEGLSSSEAFLYKSLPHWNGNHRTQILKLISWIPIGPSSELELFLYKPLSLVFATSSLNLKCDILASLKALLQNWLIWHSVSAEKLRADTTGNHTMSGFLTSVEDLIQFTGRLSTLALQMQSSALLLNFILDFYELVCDMYVRFDLPLVVLPPPGVFYPALLCTDSVNLDHLCYIMTRYRTNLVTVKDQAKHKRDKIYMTISRQTFEEYNQYLATMVGCLWTSQAFQDTHPQGIKLDPELLASTGVPSANKSFNLVFHPALIGYSSKFLYQKFPEERPFQLNLIRGHMWNKYLEFLYSQGMNGLQLFIESSVTRVSGNTEPQKEPIEKSDLAAQNLN